MSGSPIAARPLPLQDGDSSLQLQLMSKGEHYLAFEPYLNRLRENGVIQLRKINNEDRTEDRMKLFEGFVELRSGKEGNVTIMPGFLCEYGFNISLGFDIFIGANCTFVDVCPIFIGDRSMFGPNCQLYTPTHPVSPEVRNGLQGPEYAKPITIGSDCWLGGGVIVLPGVTIGDGVVVGAGSVVTKSLPDRCVAVGNPAKVIRKIEMDGSVVAV